MVYLKEIFSQFRVRKVVLALADAFIISIAALISNYLLSLFDMEISARILTFSASLSVICCFAALLSLGAYARLWRYFHKKDYLFCIYGTTIGVTVSSLLVYAFFGTPDFAYHILYLVISVLGICMFRFVFKTTFIDLVEVGTKDAVYKKTMIIGGGQACTMLLKEISNAQNSSCEEEKSTALYRPVCIIDDDRSKVGTEIGGVTVVGTTSEIHKFVEQKEIEQILFAIPSCTEDERKRILDICSATGLPVKVIPFIGSLIFDDDHVNLLDHVRDIRVEDLLGRESVRFDNKQISDFISGKICMVTGGGGSIGSELVRQIARYNPEQIIIIDIYENNAYEIQQELLMEYGNSINFVTLIASVRDYDRMNRIYEKYKPNIVFHAAAHKHVPLMETSPMEAIKNNVIGTFNTATLAQFHNVEKFVMISTDKAVNPTNVMGASKRCCEMIVQYLSQQHDGVTEFITTRFGNVLGSNGSVIPLFKKQIEQGRAVTVTHPDVIRYFMTIPEAVSLVMEAAAIASGGEIFVLDMGQPVRITALAENLIRMYGKVPYKDVEIKFTGLRPGEKIKEELLMDEEGLQKTSNKLIYIGKQIEIDAEVFEKQLYILSNAAGENNDQLAIEALHSIVPTFTTPEEFNKKALVKI